jgi:hypothetical protein
MKNYIWKLWLRPNHLTIDVANDYVAEVAPVGKTLRNIDIARLIIETGSELQVETLVDVIDRADRIRREKLQEGYKVQTGICHLSPATTGAWLGATTTDAAKHKVTLTITPTAEMRTALAGVGLEVLGIREGGEYIGLVTDITTGLTDGTITPGGQIVITGQRIKVDPVGEEGHGVFLSDGTTEYPIAPLAVNHPKEIIGIVPPQLPVGTYSLHIGTRYTGSIPLKDLRRIDYAVPLTVVGDEGNEPEETTPEEPPRED